MKLYGEIDLHSNNSVFNIIDENGHVVLKQRIANNIENILQLLEPYADRLSGLVVESTYNWYWLVDSLMKANCTVHLANTAAIQQYSGLKYGDDNSDANWLGNMLRLGVLPESYIYPKKERMVRDLLRKRMQLVQQSTQNLLSIQGLYQRHLNKKLTGDKVKQLTAEQLAMDFMDLNVRLAVQGNLAIQQCLTEQIKAIEKSLKKQLKLKDAFIQLTSIDGIGLILALTIMLETGDISRFSKVGQYASYCRCVNGKKKGKTNTKNGNKYLAWAFIEAANFAIRFNSTVKKYYQKKMAKTHMMVAKKAVAHKLARACFYVLRDQVEFDVNKAFGYST
ncbi:transposase [Candidatus Endobugula sertula]|uniref:Transposase n=1 Tax=Candidatus Endobugula sertula TaxID=62101 RepID=A0A1D2QM51_9GAMM|nr:transposase [Candidatus Endobugula sertula]